MLQTGVDLSVFARKMFVVLSHGLKLGLPAANALPLEAAGVTLSPTVAASINFVHL